MKLSKSQAERGVELFVQDLEVLTPKHYHMTQEQLLQNLNTELGRLQYARLLGVVVKEPFSDSFDRPRSTATHAYVGLKWKPRAHLEEEFKGTAWQLELIRELASDHAGKQRITDDEAIHFLEHQGRYETNLGKYIFRAFHNRICAPAASEAVKEAIAKAEKEGVKLVNPTAAGISTGIASVVAVTIGSLFSGPVAVAAAPVIGGIALLIIQVGLDGFCDWSRELSDSDKLRSAEEETETKS